MTFFSVTEFPPAAVITVSFPNCDEAAFAAAKDANTAVEKSITSCPVAVPTVKSVMMSCPNPALNPKISPSAPPCKKWAQGLLVAKYPRKSTLRY